MFFGGWLLVSTLCDFIHAKMCTVVNYGFLFQLGLHTLFYILLLFVRHSKDRYCGESQVLKSCGLVDVEQEEPYGDINLKLTPLSKAQF
jgi:hypothetical protein